MGRNEDFNNGFWDHPDIEDLSADATLLFIWSWTNPRCGMAGIYEVGRRAMTECKVPSERLDATLLELAEGAKLLYEKGVLFVVKRVARLRTKSPQVAKSVVKDLCLMPDDHPLKDAWLARYGHDSWLRSALSEARGKLTRGSGEAHENPVSVIDSVSLTTTSPEAHPSLQVSGSDSGSDRKTSKATTAVVARTSKPADQESLPGEFPDHLSPVADQVLVTLRRVQAERGGNEPTRRGVGLAIAAFDKRDYLAVVSDLEHWATAGHGQAKPVKDWVATYRTFLSKTPAGTPVRNGRRSVTSGRAVSAALNQGMVT